MKGKRDMKRKEKGWRNRALSAVLTTGMLTSLVTPVSAAEIPNTEVKTGSPAVVEEIAAIDFTDMTELSTDQLDGWIANGGSGTAQLVENESGENVLKLQRTSDGEETLLSKERLGIREDEYRYVSIETTMKLENANHANQFSIPYIKDKNGTIAYTMYVDGDWSELKSHVNGKNVLSAGEIQLDEWQTVTMDIDLKEDTYRIAVDDSYLLVGADARTKTDNLDSVKFYADSWNRGTLYIESVKVTAQKERTQPAVFYVSAEGDDSAEGTSETNAWKSIERVNQEHFIPGDQILFRSGDKWENQTLQPQGSGNETSKIVISSYGEGEKPQIAANGKKNDAVYLCNQQYWEISDLDISNTVEGFSQISNGTIPTGNVTQRNNEDGQLLGDYRGIHIAGRDKASLKGYWLHDLKVHDVTGEVAWIGDTGLKDIGIVNNAGLDGSKRTGGVLIECLQPTGNQPTQFQDIVIEDSEFINNSFCGITIKQWNGSGNQYGENPGWANRNGGKNKAPDYEDNNWYPHSNIVIQDNYINQGASAYACNGIYLTSSRDSLIQRNILEHIGTCGIELYFTDNVAVQYNEVSDVVKKGGGADDNAIDPDWRVTNALIQYNYIHDTGEGFLLCGVEFNSGVIRYNLVQDCTRSYIHYSMGSGYFQIYNNVFYRSKDGNATNNFDPWGGGKASYFNNIFYNGKDDNFIFSSGSNFSYKNNAYYGTNAPAKEQSPIILTEDPFEGEAPSMDRQGNFETGVLLEANGLTPKKTSGLIGAGVSEDANGISIDEGLKQKGSTFNFIPLDKVDTESLGNCINVGRVDYPKFENKDAEATFDSPRTQTTAAKTPTIGLFEVALDPDALVVNGSVKDLEGTPVSGAKVTVEMAGAIVQETITNEWGTYYLEEGLQEGEAVIKAVSKNYEKEGSISVTIKKGQITRGDIVIPPNDMPESYTKVVIDESFEKQTDPENFGFNKGTQITNGELVLTNGMGNYTAAVKQFGEEISGQKGVDITFDWRCESGNKMGLEFRDTEGRLLFALCAAPQKGELRHSITADPVEPENAASASEPVWTPLKLDTAKTYTIRIHGDFENQKVSYSLSEKDGDLLVQKVEEDITATGLATMIACSWYDSRPQYIDNFKLTVVEDSQSQETDKRALDALLTMIEGLNSEDYSSATWAVLEEKLEAAKAVKENAGASQEEVDAVCTELVTAMNGLKSGLNTSAAEAVIAEAEAVLAQTESSYRPSDTEAVRQCLDVVKKCLETETTTQEELNNAVMDLLDALINLKEQVNVDSLQKLVDLAEQILQESEKYTSITVQNLQKALDQAKAVLENEDRTKAQVEEAYTELTKAISELQIRGNKEVLQSLLEKAEEVQKNSSKYESTSLDGLEEAAKAAQLVYDNPDALQKEINEAATKLAEQLAQVRIVGDVNADGVVNTADAAIILKANAELTQLDETQSKVADVTGDQMIDTKDAAKVQQYAAEMISEF